MTNPAQVFELIQYIEKIYEQGELDPFINLVSTPKRVLFYLSTHDKCRPSELGETLRMSRPSVTTHLKSLESDEYIVREMNLENRREVYVSLTEKGKAAVGVALEQLFNLFSDWLDLLGPEVEHLMTILKISSDPAIIGEKFKKILTDITPSQDGQDDYED